MVFCFFFIGPSDDKSQWRKHVEVLGGSNNTLLKCSLYEMLLDHRQKLCVYLKFMIFIFFN